MTAALPPVKRRVPVAGGELEVEVAGGGKAPLILLHGWTLDRRMWRPQLESLSVRTMIVAPDRRGHGRSSAPPAIEREADDIVAILGAFGATRAVVVGMSQAGRVAVDFALRHPALTAGLVLHGVRLGRIAEDAGPDIPMAAYSADVAAGRLDDMKQEWREHPLTRPVDPAVQPIIDDMLSAYDGRDLLVDAPAPPDVAALASIDAPTLVIAGEHDTPFRKRIADDLAATLPRARRAEIAGGGHLCNLCAPDAYNRAMAEFLEDIAA
ncbi:MAG: alpha/beta fold hydrolase [Alphaproteobacteria bacterium]|nr:alpha/beta fold hydrolase [Alphaproteobacteria bacterium]